MPAYDEISFSPPAPVVSTRLRNPESGATREDVLLLIDSGADVTLLPRSAVEALGIQSSAAYELMGFDGTKSLADVVQADLLFLHKTFRGQFLLVNQEIGILGRDVLNSLAIIAGRSASHMGRAPAPCSARAPKLRSTSRSGTPRRFSGCDIRSWRQEAQRALRRWIDERPRSQFHSPTAACCARGSKPGPYLSARRRSPGAGRRRCRGAACGSGPGPGRRSRS